MRLAINKLKFNFSDTTAFVTITPGSRWPKWLWGQNVQEGSCFPMIKMFHTPSLILNLFISSKIQHQQQNLPGSLSGSVLIKKKKVCLNNKAEKAQNIVTI